MEIWESELVCGKWNNRYVRHSTISEDPEEYILCFSFLDMKHLLDIKPKGGIYIYSSSEFFTEEQEIDFKRLGKWLDFFELEPYGFKIVGKGDGAKPEITKGYHASGHASTSDIEQMIDQIDPDKIVPVHTEHPEWFKKRFDNAVIPEEGKLIKF
jgi:ribonuclease J